MVASLNIGSCTFYSDLLLLHYVSLHMLGLSTPCIDNISHEVVEVYYLNVALALFNTGGLLF